MQIYNYTPATGEYLGASQADSDPLVDGNWLIPAYATTVAPPSVESNQKAVWTGSAWSVVADYRGTEYWTADGDKHKIEALGESVPDGASLTEVLPPPSEAQIRAGKIAAARDAMKAQPAAVRAAFAGDWAAVTFLLDHDDAEAALIRFDSIIIPPDLIEQAAQIRAILASL